MSHKISTEQEKGAGTGDQAKATEHHTQNGTVDLDAS